MNVFLNIFKNQFLKEFSKGFPKNFKTFSLNPPNIMDNLSRKHLEFILKNFENLPNRFSNNFQKNFVLKNILKYKHAKNFWKHFLTLFEKIS